MALTQPGTTQLKNFLDELLSHVPADKQAAARAAYSRAQDSVVTLDGAIANVNTVAEKQRQWWEANKDAVVERNQLRAQLQGQHPNNPNPNNPNPNGAPALDPTEIAKQIARANEDTLATGLGLVTAINDIAIRHFQEFGEPLNTRELTEKALASGKQVDVYYAESVAPRRKEREDAAHAKALADAEAKGRQAGLDEALRSQGRALPYPLQSTQPTTLAGLRKPAEGTANPFSLEAAVQTATELANQQR